MNNPVASPDQEERQRARYEAVVSRDWRYEQFFNFLRISPSYLLAHRLASGAIRRQGAARPTDFREVQAHYKRLGPVIEQTYRAWWLDTGQYVFGVAVEPELEVFMRLARMQEPSGAELDRLLQSVEDYLLLERPTLASPPTLIMALPIHPDRGVLLQAINHLLNQMGTVEQSDRRVADYHVERNKIREATVRQAWRVLVERVAAPFDALWRIGNRAGVSKLHTTNEAASGDDHEVRDRRRVMAILTSRDMQRAYLLAEHAARGRFPCFDRLPDDADRPRFDLEALASVLADEVRGTTNRLSFPSERVAPRSKRR